MNGEERTTGDGPVIPDFLIKTSLGCSAVVIVNGRLSPRRMSRYRRLTGLYGPLLAGLSGWLKARYHRLAARRAKKRAIVALGRSIIVSIWHMLSRHQPYLDLGPDYYDQRRKDTKVSYFTKQLSRLGFVVSLDPAPTAA